MTAPFTPKKERPGVAFRRQQFKEAAQDVDPAAEAKAEAGPGTVGGGSMEPSHRNLAAKKRALQRLLDALKKRGESEYEDE